MLLGMKCTRSLPFDVFYAQLYYSVSNVCVIYLFVPSYDSTISFLLYRPNTPGRLSKVSKEAQVLYKKYMDLLAKLILPAGHEGVSMSGWYDYTWSTVPTKLAVYDVRC